MATQPTNLSVPSESPRDLKFNAGKIDEFVTSLVNTYVDRFGNEHYTIEGLKQLVLKQIYSLGWNLKGSFQGGGVVENPGDLLQDTSTDVWYRWDDLTSLPKTVPPESTPASAGGTGTGKWQPVDIADVLRKDLAKPTGAEMIGATNADGSTRNVQEFLLANDSSEFRSKNIAKLAAVNYKIKTRQSIKVLFQGDSITAGYDMTTTDSVPAENGDWARHATMTYPKRYVDFMSEQCGVAVVPTYRAISGYTAKQAYENPNWQSNPSCDLAFIMYGINDSKGVEGATHESYMEYMEKLIRRLINWNIGVVVLTCAAGGQGAGNPLYQIWAQQVKNMAKIYGCVHFDAHEVQYNRLFGTVQSDNTHFNSVGYAKLGESLTSMCGAGGLLETYEPVRSEVQMWPGSQSNHIGYCNPENNVATSYSAAAYTNVGIVGVLPAGQRCVMSYHFYQDCEALEIDVIGAWSDGGLTCIANNWYSPTSLEYYSFSQNINNERSQGMKSSFVSSSLNNKDGNRDGQPKFIGTIYGKGWKTVSIFNKLDRTSTADQFIQMITLRPVNLRKATPFRRGAQFGSASVVRQMYPESLGTDAAPPNAINFPSVTLPLPDGLKGVTKDNKVQYFDCAIAKVIIKAVGGTFGSQYLEGVLYKTTSGSDTFTMTTLTQTGGPTIWPSLTFTKTQKSIANTYTANQFGPGMPVRNIPFTTPDVSYGSGRKDLGDWLTITANWSGVTGGEKNAYWSIELWSIDFDGAPMASAI
ncbi:GDSL-type esterase/lipase family protein [Enterobacter hormaechei]|uniref:GDSL-type esterase/lipase family protein n=1 Tax=Enterobacter hormaechei TaxID=158836 RepID=UPI00178C52B5|nr:GDSL-type esterase/lipase family protein [Enterobacter hormaechei]